MKKKKKKSWVLPRHKVVRAVLGAFFLPYAKRKYGIKIEKFKEQGNRPYLILLNHQTAYDQFFVAEAFKGAVYYMASEDIFSLGALSKLIKFLVAPIPIKKQVTDVGAVFTCKRIIKEGGTIAIAPEGNRTYSGQTEYINPAIAGIAKVFKLPIAFFRIEGGYGIHPRWSDDVRKGTMRAYVSRVMEVDEYIRLDNDTLNEIIRQELYVDETKIEGEYTHQNLAQYLERAIYVCPHCGLSRFESNGDIIECKKCGQKVQYLSNKKLKACDGEFPFEYVKDWYAYQSAFVNQLDIPSMEGEIFEDDNALLSEVILYKKKVKISKGTKIKANNHRIAFEYKDERLEFAYDDVAAITVLGKNKLNVYAADKVYQIKGEDRFNALKYVNLYHRYKNIKEGRPDDQFLGL